MAKKKSSKRSRDQSAPLQRNAHAAGIDVGAEIHYVAVESGLDPQPVRSFGALTQDLHVLADWLCKCGVQTVAMESTGVYWIPLFQILEARGLEVCLVNARHVKNVPGRKTDVQDCQWLQYLHSVGLLHASFRPAGEICAVRSLLRHRDGLMRTACLQVQRMQKALDQMNVLLHRAVSDITGVTGLKILDAIAGGERDAVVLASPPRQALQQERSTDRQGADRRLARRTPLLPSSSPCICGACSNRPSSSVTKRSITWSRNWPTAHRPLYPRQPNQAPKPRLSLSVPSFLPSSASTSRQLKACASRLPKCFLAKLVPTSVASPVRLTLPLG